MARISAAIAGDLNVLAFLDMIAWSEGTDNGRQPTADHGHDVLVGAGCSTAAGRYQLLARYWDHYRKQLGLRDFGPISQNCVAIRQIKEQRALDDIQSGWMEETIRKCRNIWASLPVLATASTNMPPMICSPSSSPPAGCWHNPARHRYGPAADLPSLNSVLCELIFGLLGLGTLRTVNRWKRVSAIAQN